jgi:hypothetical protein
MSVHPFCNQKTQGVSLVLFSSADILALQFGISGLFSPQSVAILKIESDMRVYIVARDVSGMTPHFSGLEYASSGLLDQVHNNLVRFSLISHGTIPLVSVQLDPIRFRRFFASLWE